MNFTRDVVEAAEPQRLALIERSRDGARRRRSRPICTSATCAAATWS